MKKTLIALAVLAASGASFAQVTITGTVAMGYETDTNTMVYGATKAGNPGTVKGVENTSGLGVDTATITFTAVEDLGGGMTAKLVYGLDGAGLARGTVTGADAALSLGGSFGSFKLATAKGSDYLSAGTSGVGGAGLDGKLFTPLVVADVISYTSPSFSGFTVTVAHAEINITQADTDPATIGKGATGADVRLGASDYQRRNSYGVAYTAGALSANAAYRTYDQYGAGSAPTTATSDYKDSTIGAVSYDLGVAKLGFGFDQRSYAIGGNRVDMLVAAKVPLGAFSLGANTGIRKVDGKPSGGNGTQAGYSLVGAYALSKRTNVSLSYVSWDGANENGSAASQWGARSTYTALLLAHSF